MRVRLPVLSGIMKVPCFACWRAVIKRYINYFSEIKDRPTQEQSELLEKARYEAFVGLRLTGRVALYFLFSLTVAFVIVLFGQMQLGLGSLAGFASVVVAAGVGLIIYHRLYATLLRQGLQRVLASESSESA